MAKKEISFEKAMERLEEIVSLLEGGEYPLEKSLELFEEGVGLVKLCSSKLENVEKSIKVLTNTVDGELVESELENE